jgi:perosamine synthetase
MDGLSREGIDTRPFFRPLSSLPAFAGRMEAKKAQARNQVARDLSASAINLPSGLNLNTEKVKYVCDAFKRILTRKDK